MKVKEKDSQRWDLKALGDAMDGNLTITTVLASDSKFKKTNLVYLYYREVTLEGLTLNSSYFVAVKAWLGENNCIIMTKIFEHQALVD